MRNVHKIVIETCKKTLSLDIALHILNCKCRWRCVGTVRTQLLHPQRNNPWHPLCSGWVLPRNLKEGNLTCITKWGPVVQPIYRNRPFYPGILKIRIVSTCWKSVAIFLFLFRLAIWNSVHLTFHVTLQEPLIMDFCLDTKGVSIKVSWRNGHVTVSG
jgi:hypothetical protein